MHPEDYILADDGVGRRFADALSEKATASFDQASRRAARRALCQERPVTYPRVESLRWRLPG